MADRTFAKFTFLQDRSRLAPPRRRAAGRRQAGVPRRLRGLRRRPLAARLLNHRHARRRRPGPAQPEPQPRRPPHLPRRARPERPGEVDRDAPLVPLDDQTLALLRGAGAARDLRLRAQVPVPLPDGQAAPLVRAAAGGARADHEKPHRGRPPLPEITINTTYSFGLDDQEFVVAFEGDDPGMFLDLVNELRPTESSEYTERETPIFTCVAMSAAQGARRARRHAQPPSDRRSMSDRQALSYAIDEHDHLIKVDEGYYRFAARERLGRGAARSLGRSLWDFVAGHELVKLQRMLLRRVRGERRRRRAALPLRRPGGAPRDGHPASPPGRLRALRPLLGPAARRGAARRVPQPLLDRRGPPRRGDAGRCAAGATASWSTGSGSRSRRRRSAWSCSTAPELPAISHGICPDCNAMLLAA